MTYAPPGTMQDARAAAMYCGSLYPIALALCPLDPDAALSMRDPDHRARRAALMQALSLAEHAADQAGEQQAREIVAALMAAMRATAALLSAYDTDEAARDAEAAAAALRDATEGFIEFGRMEG
jgi:hypothetical protein